MKTWHILSGVIALAALIFGWGVMRASSSATEATPPTVLPWVPSAEELRARAEAAHYTAPDEPARGPRVTPKQLKLPTPKRFLPSTPVDDVGDDPCTFVPPSLDECAARLTLESMNSCVEYRVGLDEYKTTYC